MAEAGREAWLGGDLAEIAFLLGWSKGIGKEFLCCSDRAPANKLAEAPGWLALLAGCRGRCPPAASFQGLGRCRAWRPGVAIGPGHWLTGCEAGARVRLLRVDVPEQKSGTSTLARGFNPDSGGGRDRPERDRPEIATEHGRHRSQAPERFHPWWIPPANSAAPLEDVDLVERGLTGCGADQAPLANSLL